MASTYKRLEVKTYRQRATVTTLCWPTCGEGVLHSLLEEKIARGEEKQFTEVELDCALGCDCR